MSKAYPDSRNDIGTDFSLKFLQDLKNSAIVRDQRFSNISNGTSSFNYSKISYAAPFEKLRNTSFKVSPKAGGLRT